MRRRRIAEPTVRQELEFAESQYAALALAKAERLERARVAPPLTRIQNMLDSGKDIEENDAGTDAKEKMRYTYLENKWLKWLGECGDEVEFDPMSGLAPTVHGSCSVDNFRVRSGRCGPPGAVLDGCGDEGRGPRNPTHST